MAFIRSLTAISASLGTMRLIVPSMTTLLPNGRLPPPNTPRDAHVPTHVPDALAEPVPLALRDRGQDGEDHLADAVPADVAA
jgi:hypothetical protein